MLSNIPNEYDRNAEQARFRESMAERWPSVGKDADDADKWKAWSTAIQDRRMVLSEELETVRMLVGFLLVASVGVVVFTNRHLCNWLWPDYLWRCLAT